MRWNPALVQQLQAELGTLWLHDVNETMAIKRAAVAEGYGMEPGKFSRPYPGSVNVNITEPAPAKSPSTLLHVAAWAGLALGAAGLGAGITALLMKQGSAPQPGVGQIDLEFTPLGPDGKPKVEQVK